ncbi:MAG: hypothetical protein J6B12_01140 [Clostridia bacterium]|nr:hypothetical protein [Clostridia bacterium]
MKQANEGVLTTDATEGMTEVARCCRKKGTGETVYRLFRKDIESNTFLICVCDGEISESGELVGGLPRVSLLFERIVQGDLPPYILPEVLEDYDRENALFFANI